MAPNKALVTELLLSALGLAFYVVAMTTPRFLINETSRMSIFYFHERKIESDSWSTKSYVAYDKEHDTNGTHQLGMINVQIESLLAFVFGGFGWLILLSNIMKKAPLPPMPLTGDIFLPVAVTSEFAVLVRFIALNASHIAFASKLKTIISYSVQIPYSLILAGSGILFILFAVLRIFIRHNKCKLSTVSYQHMSYERGTNIREFMIVSQHLTEDVESNITETKV